MKHFKLANPVLTKALVLCLLIPASSANAFWLNKQNPNIWEGKATRTNRTAEFTDGNANIVVNLTNGANGTSWVWRIQEYYPEFTFFCSAASCTGSRTVTMSESVTNGFSTGILIKNPNPGFDIAQFSAAYNNSRTYTKSFAITNAVTLTSGQSAYAYRIALHKYIPDGAAAIVGYWGSPGACQSGTYNGATWTNPSCAFTWTWQKAGNWVGDMVTGHRSAICVTRNTITSFPKLGFIPAGCAVPSIPTLPVVEHVN